MSNTRIILISLGVIAACLLAFVFLPKEANPKPTPLAGSSRGAPEPKVMTFSQFYASFTAEQKSCFRQKVSADRADSLEQGIATISDAELEQLNGCIN